MRIAKVLWIRNLMLLAVLIGFPASSFAQGYRAPMSRAPSCDEMPGAYPALPDGTVPGRERWAAPCEQPTPQQPREAPRPRPAPAPQPGYEETGFYQAGPRAGALEGAAGTFGVRGGAFTLPRLRLELPSFELPSFYRVSHGARMHVRESIAPWVSTGFRRIASRVTAPQADAADTMPSERLPRSADDEECAALKAKYEEKIEELNRKIRKCDEMRKAIEQSLCDRSAGVATGYPPGQRPQCVPPHGSPANGNRSQVFPLPVPPAKGPMPRRSPASPRSGRSQVDQSSYPLPAPAEDADETTALAVDRQASRQPPVGHRFDRATGSPQPMRRPGAAAVDQVRPHIVPVSHLGAPRTDGPAQLQPLPSRYNRR